jgi:hypothetical protein
MFVPRSAEYTTWFHGSAARPRQVDHTSTFPVREASSAVRSSPQLARDGYLARIERRRRQSLDDLLDLVGRC